MTPKRYRKSGPCIVCSEETTHRTESGGRKHWRCPANEHDQCADRRDMNRRRPKGRDRDLTGALAVAATTSREAVTADV